MRDERRQDCFFFFIPHPSSFHKRTTAVTSRWVIGLACGASGDGLDAALVELDGCGLGLRARVVQAHHHPLAEDARGLLRRTAQAACDPRELSMVHRLLGENFAAAARQAADRASFSLQKTQCLGCTGHTLWGEPDGRFASLLPLGMAAIVAERTGVTTISDFRARDLAAGGLGVPLAGLADYLLFRDYQSDQSRLIIHLGAVAQVVHLPPRCRIQEIAAFEAGPCSLLLDALMRQLTSGQETFDAGGKHAVQGRCLEPVLERWLGHPFLQRRPPRALPRPLFGDAFVAQAVHQAREQNWNPFDLLCTATHFVARTIAESVRRFLPAALTTPPRMLLSGGGTRNGLLRHLLEQQFAGAHLEQTDVAGVPWQARKAVAAALLAALCLDGVPANLPQVTGAAGSRLLGSLTPGSSSNWARCLTWMTQQATVSTALQAA
jgi:anhydro-N-acetylmuramic acid kinase